MGKKQFTLIDTPGHADFSTEMERTLSVMDYAILVISGSEGIQSHTMTLWKLFESYKLPVFIFVNKMDKGEIDIQMLKHQMNVSLGGGLVQMRGAEPEDMEELAIHSERMLEEFLETGSVRDELIQEEILNRQIFTVSYGSALKMEGIEEFLKVMERYTDETLWEEEQDRDEKYSEKNHSEKNTSTDKVLDKQGVIGKVYKITRDKTGNRQTHLKVLSGILKNKMLLKGKTSGGETWEEKAEQIRLYNSTGFEALGEAKAGMIVAVTGLSQTFAGAYIGTEAADVDESKPFLQPALTYRVNFEGGVDLKIGFSKLKLLEEEHPSYHFLWGEEHCEIHVQVMGDMELEVLKAIIKERFDWDTNFDKGSILYKETVAKAVIGIGHYEPLRHYAEVQLLLEPLPAGSGLECGSLISEDRLAKNWQRLILTHLMEKSHRGTLTNSEITDLRISIVAGKASNKHTEGGDFRKATYTAIRQGLRKLLESGDMVLLEPIYSFSIEIDNQYLGRVMTDMERLGAKCKMPELMDDGVTGVIRGTGPVATLRDYQREINTFARGSGRFVATLDGYAPCHNQEEVVTAIGYDPDSDSRNRAGSVFCEQGAGVYVDWQEVDELAQAENDYILGEDGDVRQLAGEEKIALALKTSGGEVTAKELEEIFQRTYGKSKRDEQLMKERKSRSSRLKSGEIENFPMPKWRKDDKKSSNVKSKEELLVIDGYNVIFAWEELKALAKENIDSAREALIEIVRNYSGAEALPAVLVFDGYKLADNIGSSQSFEKVTVVYTKEGETADTYIEKKIYQEGSSKTITVVTSDKLVQMMASGDGAIRLSSREFLEEVQNSVGKIRNRLSNQKLPSNKPLESKFEKS